jgi:Co/Zn/Cd efflux system component
MRVLIFTVIGGAVGFAVGALGLWACWSAGVRGWIPWSQMDFGVVWLAVAGLLVGLVGAFGLHKYARSHT